MTFIGPGGPEGPALAAAWSSEGAGDEEHAALSSTSPQSSFRRGPNLQIIPIFQKCVLEAAVPSRLRSRRQKSAGQAGSLCV
jgi:hypothetical protein